MALWFWSDTPVPRTFGLCPWDLGKARSPLLHSQVGCWEQQLLTLETEFWERDRTDLL